jgi:hypothetical protein
MPAVVLRPVLALNALLNESPLYNPPAFSRCSLTTSIVHGPLRDGVCSIIFLLVLDFQRR